MRKTKATGKTIPIVREIGEPLLSGDVPSGSTIEFEVATGKIVAIETTRDDHARKMQALGFRKIGRRKVTPA